VALCAKNKVPRTIRAFPQIERYLFKFNSGRTGVFLRQALDVTEPIKKEKVARWRGEMSLISLMRTSHFSAVVRSCEL
jgi:hypothetical protein